MLNQDMLQNAKNLLNGSWDGSQTNKQAREIARERIAHYCDMLAEFASKNPTTRLAGKLTVQVKLLREQYHLN